MSATSTSPSVPVGTGDSAPDFTLPDQNGTPVTLSQFRGKSNVVLFFYPKAHTMGCTAEACAFRDQYEVFKEAGAEVIGISNDDVSTQKSFADKNRLPYTLLSDSDGAVWERYAIPKWPGVFKGRTTYLIDKAGIVRMMFNSQMQIKDHVSEALETLRQLNR